MITNLFEDIDINTAKKRVKDIDDLEFDPKAEKLYNELIDTINSKKYRDSVDYVNKISQDPKLRFILSLGFGGKFADYNLQISEKDIPVYKLYPTQSEIGTDETFKFIIEGKNISTCFSEPVLIKHPVVTFNSKYIVDGHHRWSEIYLTNPKAKIKCVDITGNLSPIDLLKIIQCTIGSNLGYLITKNIQGKNLLNLSDKEVMKYIDKISDTTIEKLKLFDVFNYRKYFLDNFHLMKHNQPIKQSQDRGIMPQTSKDPNLFKDLGLGVDDLKKK